MLLFMFTWDYEIYGEGTGNPYSLMIEPTRELLRLSDKHGAKITIFAEVAEILAFKKVAQYKDIVFQIEAQLKSALKQGHDVQLHLHPQWFGAKYVVDKWKLNYENYSIAKLPVAKSLEFIQQGKEYLECLLRPIMSDYQCIAFRAGNWCMMPSDNIITALIKGGIKSDSSVFKWGKEKTDYAYYDYSNAYSNWKPWYVNKKDINIRSCNTDSILEIPIYTEQVPILSLISWKRFKLMNKFRKATSPTVLRHNNITNINRLISLFQYQAKKFDYCKLTFTEMKKMINNMLSQDKQDNSYPICTIGHSKDFLYPKDYEKLLRHINGKHQNLIRFMTYKDVLNLFYSHAQTPTSTSAQKNL